MQELRSVANLITAVRRPLVGGQPIAAATTNSGVTPSVGTAFGNQVLPQPIKLDSLPNTTLISDDGTLIEVSQTNVQQILDGMCGNNTYGLGADILKIESPDFNQNLVPVFRKYVLSQIGPLHCIDLDGGNNPFLDLEYLEAHSSDDLRKVLIRKNFKEKQCFIFFCRHIVRFVIQNKYSQQWTG